MSEPTTHKLTVEELKTLEKIGRGIEATKDLVGDQEFLDAINPAKHLPELAFSSAVVLSVGVLANRPKWGAAFVVGSWVNLVGAQLATRYLRRKLSD